VAELLLLVALVDSARRAFPGVAFGDVARALLLLALACAAAFACARLARGARARRALPAAALALLVVVAAAGTGEQLRRRAEGFDYGRYDTALAWIGRHVPPGGRIGLAGGWSTNGLPPVTAAFGPRLENRVETVARLERGQQTAYRTRGAFLAALRRGNYDALIVGTGAVPGPPGRVREVAWSRRAGFVPVAAAHWLVAMTRTPG
jgi:hypothetical protein